MKPVFFTAIALLGLAACSKKAPAPQGLLYSLPVPYTEQIKEENARYSKMPPLRSVEALRSHRQAEQAALLSDFQKDPAAFLKKYTGGARTFLFDAVVDGGNLMRVGRVGDGGKWLSDGQNLPANAVVYSFGVGDDISFDTDMAGRFGCEVHLFDPSPGVISNFRGFEKNTACGKGRLSFHDLGLGPTSDDPRTAWDLTLDGRKCEVKDLASIARSLGHGRIDVLKVDIEGGELTALPPSVAKGDFEALGIRQLLVEIHLWDDAQFERFVRLIAELKKHRYEIFRKEFNPYDGARCAEFAFVRVN